MRDKSLMEVGMERASSEDIECLIYCRMCDSEQHWNTATGVRAGAKTLQYKKDKE